MKNAVKIPLIIAGILVLLGLIVLVIGYAVGGTSWLFGSEKYEDKTIELEESFESIKVESDSCDVRFVLAKDGEDRIEAHLQESMQLTAKVENNTLVIKCKDKRKWFQFIGFRSQESKMTVFLTEAAYNTLKMETASGDISVPNGFIFADASIATASGDVDLAANIGNKLSITTTSGDLKLGGLNDSVDVKLSTSSGDLELRDIRCGDLIVTLSSGDLNAGSVNAAKVKINGASSEITLDGVVSSSEMTITTASGDIRFTKCDAESIKVETASGDVTGSFLTGKVFNVKTASGDVRIPQDGNGGSCKINTASGDIIITIAG